VEGRFTVGRDRSFGGRRDGALGRMFLLHPGAGLKRHFKVPEEEWERWKAEEKCRAFLRDQRLTGVGALVCLKR